VTASEFAFLAFGFVFGTATGVALAFVLRVAPPAREVRLTVSHDAVPRRASTLASDAFVTAPAEPARGGPADRRMHDRLDAEPRVEPGPRPAPGFAATPAGVPVMRTPVPSVLPAPAALGEASFAAGRAAVAVTTLERPSVPVTEPVPHAPIPTPAERADEGAPAFVRMLHGDHRAMLAVVDRLAGEDGDARRAWQNDLTALVEATVARTLDLGVLVFPLGNAFWDGFTVEQCREIAGSLAARGYAFDGQGGWADGMAPGYRELTVAVADAGLDPRRIRAWPNSTEIASLYRGARIAPEELLLQRAPGLDAGDLRELLGSRGDELIRAWGAWDRVRPLLLAPAPEPSA
jgi:hypothetical protein